MDGVKAVAVGFAFKCDGGVVVDQAVVCTPTEEGFCGAFVAGEGANGQAVVAHLVKVFIDGLAGDGGDVGVVWVMGGELPEA